MSRRLMPVLAIAITAVLSVAACGGGTTPATGAASAPAPVEATPATSSDAGAGGGACAVSTAAGTVQASMAQRAFTPATIQAKVGDVIAWTNNDSLPHTATLKDDPACTTETLSSGATGALTFSAAGTYPFFCKIHSDMTGTIEVTG
jgi:plastocyanin